jgi:hypothetical protein
MRSFSYLDTGVSFAPQTPSCLFSFSLQLTPILIFTSKIMTMRLDSDFFEELPHIKLPVPYGNWCQSKADLAMLEHFLDAKWVALNFEHQQPDKWVSSSIVTPGTQIFLTCQIDRTMACRGPAIQKPLLLCHLQTTT